MKTINNDFYHDLGEKWFEEQSHPIALLRAENRLRNPWILSHVKPASMVIDLGCGAGLLTQALADAGHDVTGVDLSENSLQMAKLKDSKQRISYLHANASSVPLLSHTFDAVCAMDLLEHVTNPRQVVEEAARLLKPGGLFFFHTFNRTFLSWLIVIKGVEWCVKNTPPHMHVYNLFIRPEELSKWCQELGMQIKEIKGVGLKWDRWSTWKMVLTRTVPAQLEFCFNNSLQMGYSGFSQKRSI